MKKILFVYCFIFIFFCSDYAFSKDDEKYLTCKKAIQLLKIAKYKDMVGSGCQKERIDILNKKLNQSLEACESISFSNGKKSGFALCLDTIDEQDTKRCIESYRKKTEQEAEKDAKDYDRYFANMFSLVINPTDECDKRKNDHIKTRVKPWMSFSIDKTTLSECEDFVDDYKDFQDQQTRLSSECISRPVEGQTFDQAKCELGEKQSCKPEPGQAPPPPSRPKIHSRETQTETLFYKEYTKKEVNDLCNDGNKLMCDVLKKRRSSGF